MPYPKTNHEFYHLFSNLTKLKDFCIEYGLLEPKSICPGCKSRHNKLVFYKNNIYYRCSINKCQRRWSARNNLFNFDKKSNISLLKILEIFWYWSFASTVKDTATNCKLQKKVVINWFDKLRKFCRLSLLSAPQMD